MELKNKIKILDFWGSWCSPCKKLSPLLDELAKELDITIEKINVDENEELVEEYEIRNIPSLIFFKDGVQVKKHSGSISKVSLIKMINEL